MRIAVVSDYDLVNSNYRAYRPMQELARRGHELHLNGRGQPRYHRSVLIRADVVHIHRYLDDDMQRVARDLREAGIGIVWDNDDDLASVPRSSSVHAQFGGRARAAILANVRKMVKLADVVTTPSELLAEKYRAAGAEDVRVIENYLPNDFCGHRGDRHAGVVVGWLAGLEHHVDYHQLRLREALERVLDERRDLRIVSVGLGLGIKHDRYRHIPEVEFPLLPRTLATFDIGIAPLADIPFNRARSNIKLKEYGGGGAAWLASPVGPYLRYGEEHGGRLVDDDAWYPMLIDLVAHARVRRRLARRATRWGKTQTIGKHASLWETALSDAAAKARARRMRETAAFREGI
jgi:hypothetical protein